MIQRADGTSLQRIVWDTYPSRLGESLSRQAKRDMRHDASDAVWKVIRTSVVYGCFYRVAPRAGIRLRSPEFAPAGRVRDAIRESPPNVEASASMKGVIDESVGLGLYMMASGILYGDHNINVKMKVYNRLRNFRHRWGFVPVGVRGL